MQPSIVLGVKACLAARKAVRRFVRMLGCSGMDIQFCPLEY